jgi:acetyl-CoA acetyltransferase
VIKGVVDGAASVIVVSGEAIKKHNLTPLARIVCMLIDKYIAIDTF